MVSIRRRKLLGLCSGRNSPFLTPLPWFSDGQKPGNRGQNTKSVSVHPLPSLDVDQQNEKTISNFGHGSSNISGSISSNEQQNPQFPEVKRRKQHRRKHVENKEACNMRGVYLKNMKWQAAIKVDKKQIHLGTVGSQEEAARLYDRAAFMCGREPNFELSEEEKQELRKFKWEEFLSITRSSINTKKYHRKIGSTSQRKADLSDWEGGFSASDEAEVEA